MFSNLEKVNKRKRGREDPSLAADPPAEEGSLFANISRQKRTNGSSSSSSLLPSNNRTTLGVSRLSSRRGVKNTSQQEQLRLPLKGVVACLSGLDPEEKNILHRKISLLGGSFARNFDSLQTTHLVMSREQRGEKFQEAIRFPHIHIVVSDWVEACYRKKERVSEDRYSLLKAATKDTTDRGSLETAIEDALSRMEKNDDMLFYDFKFYLAGFDKSSPTYQSLARLIRWLAGSIYWELDHAVTHIIVQEGTKDQVRNAIQQVIRSRKDSPAFVSPWWLLSSVEKDRLMNPYDFPPTFQDRVDKTHKASEAQSKKKQRTYESDTFLGVLFALVRSAPPTNCVDFDTQELEQEIESHGGRILSNENIDALRCDLAKGQEKRSCFVLCWGGTTSAQLQAHSLLSRVAKDELCHVVEATPLWFRTCCVESRILPIERSRPLFAPVSWPMRKLVLAKETTPGKKSGVRISITGFSGSLRSSLIVLIQLLGAQYDDCMKTTTSHLICKQAEGEKYKKAQEWNIYRVSMEWLLHVSRYGFRGKANGNLSQSDSSNSAGNDSGCESQFLIEPPK